MLCFDSDTDSTHCMQFLTIIWKIQKNKYDPKTETVTYLEVIDQNSIWLFLKTASKACKFTGHASSHSILIFSRQISYSKSSDTELWKSGIWAKLLLYWWSRYVSHAKCCYPFKPYSATEPVLFLGNLSPNTWYWRPPEKRNRYLPPHAYDTRPVISLPKNPFPLVRLVVSTTGNLPVFPTNSPKTSSQLPTNHYNGHTLVGRSPKEIILAL